eukprot:scaffold1690_cov118-Isochrysis_galbana.AAC.4
MLAVVAALCTAFATPPAVLTHHPVLRAQPRRQGIVPQVVDPACQLLHSPDSACAHAAVVARAQCRVQMMAGQPSAAERVFATLPYFLPFVDGFSYGIYVFNNVPGGVEFASLVLPLVIAFNSLPFAGIVTFIGLSLFTRSSSGLPRFVRFNIQQASVRPVAGLGALFTSTLITCRAAPAAPHTLPPPSVALSCPLSPGSNSRYSPHHPFSVQ